MLTAIGTVGAVIVSLWLALRSTKIKGRATIDFKKIICCEFNSEDIVGVEVINTGSKPFKIENISVYDKQLKSWLIIMPNYNHPYCAKLGQVYLESETGLYIFTRDVFLAQLKDKMNIADSTNCIGRLKKLRFVATANLGEKIAITPGKYFFEDFDKLCNSIN